LRHKHHSLARSRNTPTTARSKRSIQCVHVCVWVCGECPLHRPRRAGLVSEKKERGGPSTQKTRSHLSAPCMTHPLALAVECNLRHQTDADASALGRASASCACYGVGYVRSATDSLNAPSSRCPIRMQSLFLRKPTRSTKSRAFKRKDAGAVFFFLAAASAVFFAAREGSKLWLAGLDQMCYRSIDIRA
jgi:hypothetical protein